MVGDWIALVDCSEHYSRVVEIYTTLGPERKRMLRVVNLHNYCLDEDSVFPIDISKVFLENNKFIEFYEGCWKREESQALIYVWPKEGLLHIVGCNDCEVNLGTIRFVHQLQHILRDCDLDSIADNFIL